MKNWNARKRIIMSEELLPEHRLTRSLSWPHLIALGEWDQFQPVYLESGTRIELGRPA